MSSSPQTDLTTEEPLLLKDLAILPKNSVVQFISEKDDGRKRGVSVGRASIMRPARKSLRKSIQIDSIPPLDPIPGVPEGLEALEGMSTIYMKREVHAWPEKLFAKDIDNRFSILNQNELRIMFAGEIPAKMGCQVLPSYSRPYKLHIYDPGGNVIMEVQRPCNAKLFCCGAEDYGNDFRVVLKKMEGGEEQYLGQITQNFHWWDCSDFGTSFDVFDDSSKKCLRIEWGRPTCNRCRSGKNEQGGLTLFEINAKGKSVLIQNFLVMDTMDPGENILLASHSLNLGIRVPSEMDCKLKALLVAFMLNVFITYYEQRTDAVSTDPLEVKRKRRLGHYCGLTGWKIFKFLVAAVLIIALAAAAITFTTEKEYRNRDNQLKIA